MRIYDPRIGKFLPVNPLTKSYPELTPYQFASNCPIEAIDLDGGEALHISYKGLPAPSMLILIFAFNTAEVNSSLVNQLLITICCTNFKLAGNEASEALFFVIRATLALEAYNP